MTLDLSTYRKAASGRSGNVVYLGTKKAYKLFNLNGAEYGREVSESEKLVNDFHLLFEKGLGSLDVILPGGTRKRHRVMQMRLAPPGKTYMLAKSGGIASFCNVLPRRPANSLTLKRLEQVFLGASRHGMKDPQFIYDVSKARVYFMDIHLGGVKNGGHCKTVADNISAMRNR